MPERKKSSTNYLNQTYLEEKCALNELLFLVSKRWVTEILFCMEDGSRRFSSIKEELELISDAILANRLRTLEAEGLITRKMYEDFPPKVEYSLTEKGIELCGLLEGLCTFAESCKAAATAATTA